MCPCSIYFGLKVVPMYIGTLGPMYILFWHMNPWGFDLRKAHVASGRSSGLPCRALPDEAGESRAEYAQGHLKMG